ncbi:sporulation protein YqfC [Desulfonispora thiosulfatigenes DSM 11270]|uniref:Sporulation protein YqfC n=1 Tax=Desulfonispora thiosulfatigenes DSM 11270 TaxID=656914 RepID=A0A1W1VC74_DESTI|nr:sporulation protein YqfC [Desulfonispora thiosulfatigenes]SMB90968.1 sporulation protein YqfC [Desulfonispora thiosulfatigenes DSM 11270]
MKNIKHQFSSMFDIPKDIMLDLPKISVMGDIQVYIENHRGIIEYKTENVRVSTTLGEINIEGEELVLRNIGAEEIYVDGKIKNISFER